MTEMVKTGLENTGVCSVEFESAGYLANYCGGDLRQAARLSFEILKKLLKKE